MGQKSSELGTVSLFVVVAARLTGLDEAIRQIDEESRLDRVPH